MVKSPSNCKNSLKNGKMVKSPSNCKKSLKSVKIVKNPSQALVALKKNFGGPQRLWCPPKALVCQKLWCVKSVLQKRHDIHKYTNAQCHSHNVICTMSCVLF